MYLILFVAGEVIATATENRAYHGVVGPQTIFVVRFIGPYVTFYRTDMPESYIERVVQGKQPKKLLYLVRFRGTVFLCKWVLMMVLDNIKHWLSKFNHIIGEPQKPPNLPLNAFGLSLMKPAERKLIFNYMYPTMHSNGSSKNFKFDKTLYTR